MTAVIAVHCGAGNHNSSRYHQYNKLSKKACRKAIEVLKSGGTALEAVKTAITENDPLTNCGYGSNLTQGGTVEGDASIMDGRTLHHGACGAVKCVKNPIHLAYDLCIKQSIPLPCGLVPPCLLVGKGAFKYAKDVGLKTIKSEKMISPKALAQYNKYKKLIETNKGAALDTVGAVCLDMYGNVAAGCSSGGIILKKAGRIGQGALFASGVWADCFNTENENSIAVCTSGCGEHLIRTQLAKTIGEELKGAECPTTTLNKIITEEFLNSRYLKDIKTKLCGVLILQVDHHTKDVNILWGHTTETMSIGVMKSSEKNPKALISELPLEVSVGDKVNVSGIFYKTE